MGGYLLRNNRIVHVWFICAFLKTIKCNHDATILKKHYVEYAPSEGQKVKLHFFKDNSWWNTEDLYS